MTTTVANILIGAISLSVCVTQSGICIAQTSSQDSSSYPQRRYDADLVDCDNVTKIVFVSFFPCLRTDGDTDFKASERLGECDLLAEAAAYLAVDRVNQDPDILPNITLELYPIYIPAISESVTQLDEQYISTVQILDLLRTPDSDIVWGFVGPGDNPTLTEFIAPISEKSGLLTVSYGTRATIADDDTSIFYRTLTSEYVSNLARLFLLVRHKWYRIAILYSTLDDYYLQEKTHFISLFNNYVADNTIVSSILSGNTDLPESISLGITETFTDSPDTALGSIKSYSINIIVGFFGPENARRVLCSANSMELVSADHAWVLPSYYDPNWWRLPNGTTAADYNCSDEKMSEILESVIFIDNVKYPPVGTTLEDFHSQLLTKAVDLFPSLTEEDLKPYLLRSRATNAYDAVTLLAKSVDVAFKQGGDSCTNTSIIQVSLDKVFLDCELCRLYSAFPDCAQIDDEEFLKSVSNCSSCGDSATVTLTTEEFTELYPALLQEGLRSQYVLDGYGQTLYSQFHEGEECPIVLWWPMREYNKSYLLISDFDVPDTSGYCVARSLNLSRKNFVSEGSNCLTNFDWRGSSTPPSSNFLEVSYIPLGGLVATSVFVLIGLVLAILLMAFNIIWRHNKNVKATSPWLNVILLFGIFIRLPSTFYDGLVFSSNYYSGLKGMDLTPLCHFGLWQYYIGDTLFVASLLAKNWRIYRIFFNKKLIQRGDRLSDHMLMFGVLIVMLPVVIVLTAWSIVGYSHEGHVGLNSDVLKIVNVTYCDTDHLVVFEGVTNGLIVLLYIFLFILSLLTATVPSATFRRQGISTYKAALLFIIPSPFFFITRTSLVVSSPQSSSQFQLLLLLIETAWTLVLPFIFMLVLFLPIIYAVVKDYLRKKHARAEEKEGRRLTQRHNDLKHLAESLKVQLKKIDKDIVKLKEANDSAPPLPTKDLSEKSCSLTKTCDSKVNGTIRCAVNTSFTDHDEERKTDDLDFERTHDTFNATQFLSSKDCKAQLKMSAQNDTHQLCENASQHQTAHESVLFEGPENSSENLKVAVEPKSPTHKDTLL